MWELKNLGIFAHIARSRTRHSHRTCQIGKPVSYSDGAGSEAPSSEDLMEICQLSKKLEHFLCRRILIQNGLLVGDPIFYPTSLALTAIFGWKGLENGI